MTYSNDEIDAAILRLAADVERRSTVPEFHGAAMAEMLDALRRMEGARRAGDIPAAVVGAAAARAGLEAYRPTNATSRSKAILSEIVAGLIAEPPSQ
jgi:hypothetical protein